MNSNSRATFKNSSEFSEFSEIFYIERLYSEKAKKLSSELSNETARRILKELYKNPLSITDLSTKLDIPISTVQYHINKLIELGVIKVAQKRIGRRMRDVKIYVYEKECIVFLTSIEKRDFIDLVRNYTFHKLKTRLPAILSISAVFGLIFAFAGSLIVKEIIRNNIAEIPGIAGGAGGIDLSSVLIVMFGVYLISTIITLTLLIKFIIKK